MISKEKRIIYNAFADLVFVLHLGLVLFVTFGWLIPGFYYKHLIALLIVFLADIFLGYCPLTPMEFNIRRKLNPGRIYDNSCIMHYIKVVFNLKPSVKTSENQTFFKKHMFKFILLGLFAVSTLSHLII